MENERRQPANHRTTDHRQQEKHQSTGNGYKKVGFVVLTLFLIGCCTTAMIAGIFMKYVNTSLAPALQVNADDYTLNLSSIIYYQDKDSQEWKEFQMVHGDENRIWVDYGQMPDALWQAAVSIEDERFFEHHGVDWKRTMGATLNMFIGMRNTFGGSTITQQLLKNMTEDNAGTVNRKVREIFRALEFEKNYTKQEILEMYLNFIYLGKTCYGVQTAAGYYFDKDVSELDLAECASLIAITNNPSMYGPMYDIEISIKKDDGSTVTKTPRELNKQRQETILDKMCERGYITEEERDAAKAEELLFTDGTTSAQDVVKEATGGLDINSWYVDQVILDVSSDLAAKLGITDKEARVKLYNSGYRIYTTLDPDIQAIAESVYENRENLNVTSSSGQLLQSGITIIEPSTGNIVAIVGKVGEKTDNLGWNYAVGRRQVGSSIKPLTVYAPALDAGVVSLASTFDNYPVQLMNDTPWPKNSPQGYSGWTTLSTGVAQSINTVAVQVLQKLGVSNSYAFATEKLNLGLVASDMDVSPLGLGGLTKGLNTVEMAAAYATFANDGIYNEPRTYVRVTDAEGNTILENEGESHVAMKDTTAYFMNQLLQGVVTGGTGTSANFGGMTICGKTGTTSENNDRYFVGYTPYYCAAVWCGYDQPERISYSGNPSITMWKKVMSKIHEDLPNESFKRPTANYVTVNVCADSGLLATDACAADIRGTSRVRSVTVLSGTEPTESCNLHVYCSYCAEGHCLATDHCPAEAVTQVSVLDYTRTAYFNKDGSRITATDDPYLLISLKRAIGLEPILNPDGTEGYPAVIGCPVHYNYNSETPVEDPSNPGENPPADSGNLNPGGSTGDPSTKPGEPAEPDLEDPSGGFGDASGDWWNTLWNG